MRDEHERDPADHEENVDSEAEQLNNAPESALPEADHSSEEIIPEQSEAPPKRKPFTSRMLGKIGINTSPAVDWIFDWVQIFVIAGLLAWLTMSEGTVRMRVPTASMVPTIEVGDSFFVDKLTYKLGLRTPNPGDIIVFWHTDQFSRCKERILIFWTSDEEKPCKERFVKRLIAEGPAEVKIIQGKIHVDGEVLSGPAFERDYMCGNNEHRDPLLRSPDGCTHIVPENEFFVLGDNTPNSNDSRFWGTVSTDEFIGEPFLRVLPLRRIGFMNGYFGSPR